MIYRIYTETKSNLIKLTSQFFDGFTVFEVAGYWKGKREWATVIEIHTEDVFEATAVYTLASLIKTTNAQEAVRVVAITPENIIDI